MINIFMGGTTSKSSISHNERLSIKKRDELSTAIHNDDNETINRLCNPEFISNLIFESELTKLRTHMPFLRLVLKHLTHEEDVQSNDLIYKVISYGEQPLPANAIRRLRNLGMNDSDIFGLHLATNTEFKVNDSFKSNVFDCLNVISRQKTDYQIMRGFMHMIKSNSDKTMSAIPWYIRGTSSRNIYLLLCVIDNMHQFQDALITAFLLWCRIEGTKTSSDDKQETSRDWWIKIFNKLSTLEGFGIDAFKNEILNKAQGECLDIINSMIGSATRSLNPSANM